MPVRRYSSGTKWEPVVGYSRAVAAGGFVFVSGCTSVAGAEFVHPGDAYAQAAQALRNAGQGLAGLGASFADVVQTRMYVTDIERWEEIGRAHGEVFGDVLPAATMVEVARLIDPRMLVEIEVVAYRPETGAGVKLSGAPIARSWCPAPPRPRLSPSATDAQYGFTFTPGAAATVVTRASQAPPQTATPGLGLRLGQAG